jgi:hypothetical protein
MQKRRFFGTIALVMLALGVGIGLSYPAAAEEASSAHYQLSETQFNSGSTLNGCSTEYCARVNIGDSSIGNSKSDGESSATFGSVTPDRPSLDVIVEPGVSNLGTLSTETTGAKTLVVKIRSYLSDGYVLQIRGTPPKYGNHTLKTSSTPVASVPGTEQFGINLIRREKEKIQNRLAPALVSGWNSAIARRQPGRRPIIRSFIHRC